MEDISVVVPVYNAAETIIECLDSIVTELTANAYTWQLIVVDDGSKDTSLNKIEAYKNASPYSQRIHVVAQKNQGAAVARNTGMAIATGTFVAFNDSDDRWLPGRLAWQIDYLLSHPSAAMVAGIYGENRMSRLKKIEGMCLITIKDQIFKNYFSPPCVVFRRSVLQEVGFFHTQMRYAEEGYFFNKMVYHCDCFLKEKKVAESITRKNLWGECGLSGNLWGMEKGELFNLYAAYQAGFVTCGMYVSAVLFSLLKYSRRLLIKTIRPNQHEK